MYVAAGLKATPTKPVKQPVKQLLGENRILSLPHMRSSLPQISMSLILVRIYGLGPIKLFK
jgi:hypothetical protein